MAKVRCKETGMNSFFGKFLYEQKVSPNHFLRKLDEVIDWDRFTAKLLSHYKGKGEIGQAPYNPITILKMLLLSYLWNVSERMIEMLANDSLSIGFFLGLGADEKAPDHSTLTLFKNRLLQNGGKEGKKHKETQYYYGYKDQVSLNAGTGLVTSVIPGYARDYDGHKLKKLVERDLKKGIEVGTVAGDKGYDDGDNHYYLEQKGINSAIRLNNYRTEKKDGNKEGWVKLKESSEYQEGLKERYKVERKFGEAKKWHGFGRCRYVGFMRHAIQSYLTFMALNLKRLVKLLTGVSFRGEGRTYALSS